MNRAQAVDRAMAQAERIAESRPDVNLVYEGRKRVAGTDTDEPAIVFVVDAKLDAQALALAGLEPIPEMIFVPGGPVFATDVVEGPPQRIELLLIPFPELRVEPFSLYAQAADANREWYDYPIPGGVQIAPVGAKWLGTGGQPCGWRNPKKPESGNIWGIVTNRHVASGEVFGLGAPIGQPQGVPRAAFGTLAYSPAILFDGGRNLLDAAFVEAEDDGGRSRMAAEIVGIGALAWGGSPRAPKIGDPVAKSGRTTGVTTGRVVGLKASASVGYGKNQTGRFVDQIVIEGDDGREFSAPGDSGSMIVFRDTREPAGLLFAGGGGRTTANRIDHLVRAGFVFYAA